MPSLVTTIEDFSPLLVYSTDWSQGAGDTDNQISKYSASSFFATSTAGGSVTFSFTGTGIEIFGSKRSNHGNYQVQLDGSSFPAQSGTAADPGTFQTSLFSQTNLNDGPHTIALTNLGTNKQFLDIDFITLRSSVGGVDEKLIMTTVQDNDPAFVYSPVNSWSNTPDNLGTFSGGSGHSTPDGSMTFTFDGDAVSLYGPVGPSAASYVIQVDEGAATISSATKARFEPGVLLYRGGNLGPGKHTLKFSCRPATGQSCSVDYAEVYTTQRLSGSASKSISVGAIVGIVIATLAFVAILVFTLFWYLRRRRSKRRQENRDFLSASLNTPHPSFREAQQIVMDTRPTSSSGYSHTAPLPNPYPYTYPDSIPHHDVVYDATPSTQGVSPSAMSKDASSNSVSLTSPRSTISEDNASSSTRSNSRRTIVSRRSIANSTSPRPLRSASLVKGQPPLPITAGQVLSNVPDDELRTTRRVVEGRPQDFGSLSREGVSGGNNSEYIESNPPPDYSQATQTYQGRDSMIS